MLFAAPTLLFSSQHVFNPRLRCTAPLTSPCCCSCVAVFPTAVCAPGRFGVSCEECPAGLCCPRGAGFNDDDNNRQMAINPAPVFPCPDHMTSPAGSASEGQCTCLAGFGGRDCAKRQAHGQMGGKVLNQESSPQVATLAGRNASCALLDTPRSRERPVQTSASASRARTTTTPVKPAPAASGLMMVTSAKSAPQT